MLKLREFSSDGSFLMLSKNNLICPRFHSGLPPCSLRLHVYTALQKSHTFSLFLRIGFTIGSIRIYYIVLYYNICLCIFYFFHVYNMTYIVCIPSYSRAAFCNEKTLNMLRAYDIPKEIIYVYVASQEEYDRYKEVLDASLYGDLVIGVRGLIQQRQYIME